MERRTERLRNGKIDVIRERYKETKSDRAGRWGN